MTMILDYSEHFWGDKHIGYNVLYENLKRGEDTVQEFSTFVKERISLEEDLNKFLNKSLIRVNQYVSNKGPFTESWLLTKNTLELYCEIQNATLKNLFDLSKEVIKYHDDLVKSRKRVKEQDVIDAVNLMQTTTTCLQKAKETYHHRCNEYLSLKNEAQAKEVNKCKSKVIKSHEEYKSYVEKYQSVRDNFEEKLTKSAKAFQAHDTAHLQQMKTFFIQLAKSIENAHNSVSQVTSDYKNNLESIDVDKIMLKFIEEKGTGCEKPEKIQWTENDELIDFDLVSHIASSHSAPSSSNSSAIVGAISTENSNQLVQNIVDLDSPLWNDANNKSPIDSDVEPNDNKQTSSTTNLSSLMFGSSLGRQKLTQWLPRRKKNASQSSLPATDDPTINSGFNDSSKSGFLKRYRKSKNELSTTNENEDNKSVSSSAKSVDDRMSNFGTSSLAWDTEGIPTSNDQPMVDEEGFTIRPPENKNKSQWSSATSSSDEDDENEFQTSKIRQLQIKPINSSDTKINASVDELRNAIGHITLQRSTTFDKDPWGGNSSGDFTQSLNTGIKPLRPAYTGDEHLRKKHNQDLDFTFGFSQSIGGISGSAIARARPRSNTPTVHALTSSLSGISTNDSSSTKSDIITNDNKEPTTPLAGFNDNFANFSLMGSTITQPQPNPKNPIAMAMNEFIHVWFKSNNEILPEIKVFGTIVISFPSILVKKLTELTPDLKPIKFTIENAMKIKSIIPNKRLILPMPLPDIPTNTYDFTIDKVSLANWLLDEIKDNPNLNFYNIDIVRYELNTDNYLPPLILKSYWKLNDNETGIRVDYKLNNDMENNINDKPLLNIIFNTVIDGDADLINSIPDAKYDKNTKTLTWTLSELTQHGDKNGVLKARLNLKSGPSNPSNTVVQFQVSDANMSKMTIKMDPDNGYNLSMIRRKLITGKYFCEPETR